MSRKLCGHCAVSPQGIGYVHTPGIYVDMVLQGVNYKKPIEKLTLRELVLMAEMGMLDDMPGAVAEYLADAGREQRLAGDGRGAAIPRIITPEFVRDEVARGRYGPGEGVTGRVLGTGQPAIVQDVDAEPAFLFRAVPRARPAAEVGVSSRAARVRRALPTLAAVTAGSVAEDRLASTTTDAGLGWASPWLQGTNTDSGKGGKLRDQTTDNTTNTP